MSFERYTLYPLPLSSIFLFLQANVLIDDDSHPKIADFGLAKLSPDDSKSSHGGKGCLRWQAPELIITTRFQPISKGITTETDVFAFGRVCLEVGTNFAPMVHYHANIMYR